MSRRFWRDPNPTALLLENVIAVAAFVDFVRRTLLVSHFSARLRTHLRPLFHELFGGLHELVGSGMP